MRGKSDSQPMMFYALDIESLIRADHPLRAIKVRVDAQLKLMDNTFNASYGQTGRPSVPPAGGQVRPSRKRRTTLSSHPPKRRNGLSLCVVIALFGNPT